MNIDITKFPPEVIIYGGLTLGLLYSLYVMLRTNKYYFNHTNDVINANSGALTDNAVANQRLADSHEKLSDSIERSHTQLADAINKIAEVLEKK